MTDKEFEKKHSLGRLSRGELRRVKKRYFGGDKSAINFGIIPVIFASAVQKYINSRLVSKTVIKTNFDDRP